MIEKHPNKLGMLHKVREDDVLIKIVRTNNQKSEAVMVPEKMMKYILHEAHERLGHPGVCLLTGFLFTAPIIDKRAETVVNAYLGNIYSITGESKYILSDRGSEFISKTFKEVTERSQLTQTFTLPRDPKANLILK